MDELTPRERIVYNCIIEYIQEHGYSPTCRELCVMTGLKSTSCIHDYLHRLTNKKLIIAHGDLPRAIKIIGYKFVKEE